MVKPIKYLSPSSMFEFMDCPERFRLKRIVGHKEPRLPSLPADTGTAFDAYVKHAIEPSLKVEDLLAEFEPGKHIEHKQAIMIGRTIFQGYKKCGALDALIAEGIGEVEVDEIVTLNGVPVRGKPDGYMGHGGALDWKVNGVGSKSGQSPKQGYSRRIDMDLVKVTFKDRGAHKKKGIYLEEVNFKWAFQTCIYNFMRGALPGNVMRSAIDQVAVRKTTVAFCAFRCFIGVKFQWMVWNLIKTIWDDIHDDCWAMPIYQERKCESHFGKVCPMADNCSAYPKPEPVILGNN